MVEGTSAAPPRWWQDARWLTAIVAFAIVASLLWGLFGPEPAVVVSRETTFITGPLRPDGLPDYAAHVLHLAGRGTPPEDNAAVAVLHATWPMGLDAAQLAAVCQELGIPDTPPDVAPLVLAYDDEELKSRLGDLLGPLPQPSPSQADPASERRREVGGMIDRSLAASWRAEDCPPLADWVARSSPALDLVVVGAARPRYFMPPADLLTAGPGRPLLTDAVADIQTLRDVTRAFATRAMLHAGEGRPADAWRDIHAIHRLSRLLAPPDRGGFMLTHLVSVAIGATANGLTLELLQAPHLTAGQVATIRRDLEALPPRAAAAAALTLERIGGLDVAALLSRSRREEWAELVDLPAAGLRTSLDVNVVLRELNSYYDRIDAAARLPDRAAREQACVELEAGLIDRVGTGGPGRLAAWWLRMATSRSARSADVAARLLCVLGPAIQSYLDACDRAGVEFDLLRVAAALAEYRVRGLGGPGAPYPDDLDALVPDVLAELPRDPFLGGPLAYERRGDGYLLYAVGTNGIDEGGTSADIVKGEWQPEDPTGSGPKYGLDNVIRVPTPRRGFLTEATP